MGAEGLLPTAADFASRLFHAGLWGGLFIAGVGAACRLALRLPASVRAWLWWLACLKLVFDLCGASPIALPLLPAPAVRSASAPASTTARGADAILSPFAGPTALKRALPSEESDSRPALAPYRSRLSWPLGLVIVWLAGVFVSLMTTLRHGVRLARIVHAATAAPLAGLEIGALATAVGLRRAPRVLQHPGISAPCITGGFQSVILLPPGLAQTLTDDELRLALAHEMAHLRRGDLRLALVPTLARALFFFHPLVWWASAEWAAAREEACDALAVQATGISTARLSRLLLKMASGETCAPALGLSSGYHGLRRRLLALTQGSRESRRISCWLLAFSLPLLLPWHLTAAVRVPSAVPSQDAALYQITDLGELGGGGVVALNNAGQVGGTMPGVGEMTQGFRWEAGRLVTTGALPKQHASIAYGLNSRGQAAGVSYNLPGRGRAFFWDGLTHRIGSLPGFPYSEAHGVNDSGQVAGSAETGGHDRWRARVARAFFWNAGEMTDLGTLGGPYSQAYGLNNAGVVVGKADTPVFGQTHAFAWADGQMQDLGTLGGANSLAYHVNDRGQAVGSSEIGEGETRHAFLAADGQMRDLGTVPGLADSVAYDVNSAGEAVGTAMPAPDAPGRHALLWRSGQTIDLNQLLPPNSGWTLDEARAINDRGQIAGQGHFHGQPRAFLLTPR